MHVGIACCKHTEIPNAWSIN